MHNTNLLNKRYRWNFTNKFLVCIVNKGNFSLKQINTKLSNYNITTHQVALTIFKSHPIELYPAKNRFYFQRLLYDTKTARHRISDLLFCYATLFFIFPLSRIVTHQAIRWPGFLFFWLKIKTSEKRNIKFKWFNIIAQYY